MFKLEANWNLQGLDNLGLRKLNQFETFADSWPTIEMAREEANIMLSAMSERYKQNLLGLRIVKVEKFEIVTGEF